MGKVTRSLALLSEQPSRTIWTKRQSIMETDGTQEALLRCNELEGGEMEKVKLFTPTTSRSIASSKKTLWSRTAVNCRANTPLSGEKRLELTNTSGCFSDAPAQTRRQVQLSTNANPDVHRLRNAESMAHQQSPILYQRTIKWETAFQLDWLKTSRLKRRLLPLCIYSKPNF